MQETIEKLSRCKFDYEIGEILLSVDEIKVNLEAGMKCISSFIITNSQDTTMKGIVYSSREIITFYDNQFNGVRNEIKYEINGRDLTQGENYIAEITIITDYGEIVLPVSIHIIAPFCTTPFGEMKTLSQFSEFAKDDWNGACSLFVSSEFERVFLDNSRNQLLYETLMKSDYKDRALEEFLIAIGEKPPVSIQIDKQEFEYEIDSTESFMDQLTITKDFWGYVEIEVTKDSEFITLEHSKILLEDFIGSTYNIEFVINPALLRDGNNFGKIHINTYNQTYVVNIICHYVKETRDREVDHILHKKNILKLMKLYLNFRQGRMERDEYTKEMEGILQNTPENQSFFYDIYRTHLAIIRNQEEEAEVLLNSLLEYEVVSQKRMGVEYCAYLYLEALIQKDPEITNHGVNEIRYIYENGHKDDRILWFLLYLDKNYEENIIYKLAQIKEQVLSGSHSPILYLEALDIFNNDPSFLQELGEFETQVMNYGVKYDCIKKEAQEQFTFLATREKTFRYSIFKNLVVLYEKYDTEEILTGICTMLIKGQKTDKKYFPWYRLGVEAQLKITGIHENYMYSIDEGTNIVLASPILLYFMYNSNLSDQRKAYLYAYIIKNKAQNGSIYRTYLKQMENFCLKQVQLHNINQNLSVIYNELLLVHMISENIAYDLPYIMFRHRILCDNKNMKGVVVVHEELKEETYAPFVDGEAYVDIFTQEAKIFLVDQNDNRYHSSIEYKSIKLMNWESFIDAYYSYQIDNYMVLLALTRIYDKQHRYDDNTMLLREKVLHLPGLRKEYYSIHLPRVIQYHYDRLDREYLINNLTYVDMECLNKHERALTLEYAIICEMYREVLSLIRVYGYEEISGKKIFLLCKGHLQENDEAIEEYHHGLEELCFYCFKAGKYDESILLFLVEHYNGTTKEMYELWKECKRKRLGALPLEERLICQMLFTHNNTKVIFEVFDSYYQEGHNAKLIKAFLSFYAYQYLAHNKTIPEELFTILQKELVITEYDIYMLAVLKYLSNKNKLKEDQVKFAKYHVNEYIKKGFALPFFKNFRKYFLLPSYIIEKNYVEYVTDPNKKVVIHYRRKDRDEEFNTSVMENVYLGIHVKEFILFSKEELEYYITEDDGEEPIIQRTIISGDRPIEEEVNSKYNAINLMIMAKELKDDKTLVKLMEDYIAKEHTKLQLFQIK